MAEFIENHHSTYTIGDDNSPSGRTVVVGYVCKCGARMEIGVKEEGRLEPGWTREDQPALLNGNKHTVVTLRCPDCSRP